jgi:hypothetical protein
MRVDQLTDEEMVGIAANVDNVLHSMAEITNLPSLSISSIILARLMWFTKDTGCEEDFKKLLRKVADGDIKGPVRNEFMH